MELLTEILKLDIPERKKNQLKKLFYKQRFDIQQEQYQQAKNDCYTEVQRAVWEEVTEDLLNIVEKVRAMKNQ